MRIDGLGELHRVFVGIELSEPPVDRVVARCRVERRGLRALPPGDRALRLCLIWGLSGLALFSLVSGKQVPLIADIEKVVYGAGKGNLQDASKIGTVLYNRGVSAAVLSVEAIRKGQEKYGKGKALNGEQTRWALENLDITDARLKAIGATNLLPQIKTSCDNHEGSGKVKIQQWDGAKWVPVSDWIEGNKALIHPLFQASAKQYAKEKGITPRDCSKEK